MTDLDSETALIESSEEIPIPFIPSGSRTLEAFAMAVAIGMRAAPPRNDAAEVMDVDAVALFLGVDRKTVYDYVGRGEIPHRRLGKRILFSRSALVAWLAGECRAASYQRGR